jgi:benzylsuccinate CoA-transferase BbsE subunit
MRRTGQHIGSARVRRRMIFPCADGHVSLLLIGAQGSPSTRALMGWMGEHGMLPAWLVEWPWESWEPGWSMAMTPERRAEQIRIEEIVAAFLATRTKAEIYREGVRRRILIAPVATVSDIAADPQLAFREYFRPVAAPGGGRTVRFPGPFARLSATPLADPRRAPEVGEHNDAVYGELCGYPRATLDRLRAEGTI